MTWPIYVLRRFAANVDLHIEYLVCLNKTIQFGL